MMIIGIEFEIDDEPSKFWVLTNFTWQFLFFEMQVKHSPFYLLKPYKMIKK